MDNISKAVDCGYKCGPLPVCAPLALSYTPMQQSAEPAFNAADALSRGTLFPGLELPFMNIVNKTPGKTGPLRELMALDFAAYELGLYLDTHKNDAEAFAAYKSVLALSAEGRRRYTQLYGPLTKSELLAAESYTWLDNPWPWDLAASTEDR